MKNVIHTFAAFAATAGSVPDWIQLVPAGAFKATDGRGPWEVTDADAVIAASLQAGGRLPVDENHSTDLAAKEGRPAPARGWIVQLQKRDDGIWGRVEWTPAGKALIEERAYNGVSPVIKFTGKRVTQILRAAITNDPALTAIASIFHGSTDMTLSALRTALKLDDASDETALLSAITALQTKAASAAEAGTLLATLAKAAGAAETSTAEQLVAHLAAQKAKGDPEQLVAQVVALQTTVTTLQAKAAATEGAALVDEAIKAGKPIKPLRDHYIKRFATDPEGVKTELAALASVHHGGVLLDPKRAAPKIAPDADPAEIARVATLHAKEHGIPHDQAVLVVTGQS